MCKAELETRICCVCHKPFTVRAKGSNYYKVPKGADRGRNFKTCSKRCATMWDNSRNKKKLLIYWRIKEFMDGKEYNKAELNYKDKKILPSLDKLA